MSEQQNDNEPRHYNADDIRRYIAGEMPATEMHALEQASLEDPMLGDALEGMREVKADTRDDLERLKRRLAEKGKETRLVVPIWRRTWTKITAASVIVLIGLAALNRYIVRNTYSPQTIAVSKQDKKAVPAAETTTSASANADSVPGHKPVASDGNITQRDLAPVAAARAKAPGKNMPAPAAPTLQTEPISNKTDQRNEAELTKKKMMIEKEEDLSAASGSIPQDSVRPSSNAPVAAARMSKAAEESSPAAELEGKVAGLSITDQKSKNRISVPWSGQVLDDKGIPIAGVLIQDGKQSTITDLQGKFVISAPAGAGQLDISSVGYIPQTLIAAGLPENDLTIKLKTASIALNEVVVSGYGRQKDQTVPRTTNPGPKPAAGWDSYHNYLGVRKRQSGIDSSLHGTEIVTFSITRNGQPVDFFVDESLSDEHDSLAVRLIRNGPRWKPAKDTAHRVSLALPY